MKLITRDTGYAVSALCYIAKNKTRRISVTELTRHLRIPRYFLRKIMQRLNKEGLVTSFKGQGGGFVLTRIPQEIHLVDLINIFQGPTRLSECIFKKKVCPNIKRCKLKKKIEQIQDYVSAEVKKITLASLF